LSIEMESMARGDVARQSNTTARLAVWPTFMRAENSQEPPALVRRWQSAIANTLGTPLQRLAIIRRQFDRWKNLPRSPPTTSASSLLVLWLGKNSIQNLPDWILRHTF
jgi:hypothetical protein